MPDQDRSLWDYAQIQRGMTVLERAQRPGGGAKLYVLQAAIAACHVRVRTAEEADRDRIVLLYDAFPGINPSPMVALNRAVAVGGVQGPAAGLDAIDTAAPLAGDCALAGFDFFPSVRGDLLHLYGYGSNAELDLESAAAPWRAWMAQRYPVPAEPQARGAVPSAELIITSAPSPP